VSSPVSIQPDTLQSAGNGLNSVSSMLKDELNSLESELQSFGDCWGNDDIGSLIGAAYQEVVSWAFDCLREVVDEIGQSGGDLINQAQQWSDYEQQVENGFKQFLGQLGSA
jgi:hypothetical protein